MSIGVEFKPFANLPVQLPKKPENNIMPGLNQNPVQNMPVQNAQSEDASDKKKLPKAKTAAAIAGFIAFAGIIIWGMPSLRHALFDNNKKSKALSGKVFKNALENKYFMVLREKFEKAADTVENHVTNPIKNFLRQNLFNYINIDDKK